MKKYPDNYNYPLDLSNFTIKHRPDKHGLFHDHENVSFEAGTAKLRAGWSYRPDAVFSVATLIGHGFGYGVYDFEAKFPCSPGSHPAIFLQHKETLISLVDGDVHGRWKLYAGYNHTSYDEEGTKSTESIHVKLKRGWQNPSSWQRYIFRVDRKGITMEKDWKDGSKIMQIIYQDGLWLPEAMTLNIVNWIDPGAKKIKPGTFEVRNFRYLPFM